MTEFETRPSVARPSVERQSVHPSITEDQISNLVDRFYEKVALNERLGPIFQHHVHGDWDVHLAKMKTFWRSVLLRTGEYKGKPVPVHQRLEGIETQDFEEWLNLFYSTTQSTFGEEAALLVNEAARRIATSLWLARSNDPFVSPPVWPAAKEDMSASSAPTFQR